MKQNEHKNTGLLGPIILCLLTIAADVIYYWQAMSSMNENEAVSFTDSAFNHMEYINIAGSALVLSGAAVLLSRYRNNRKAVIGSAAMIGVGLLLVGYFFVFVLRSMA